MADIRVSDVKQMTDTELDAGLAERLAFDGCDNCGSLVPCGCDISGIGCGPNRFSSDPAASAQLRARMRELGWNWKLETRMNGYSAFIWKKGFCPDAWSETECRSFAEAAFAALLSPRRSWRKP